jgi:hypothetical protein
MNDVVNVSCMQSVKVYLMKLNAAIIVSGKMGGGEDVGLLGCNAVWTCRTSALKMEIVCLSETLVPTYKFTRSYNLEDQHQHFHYRENLKPKTGEVLKWQCLLKQRYCVCKSDQEKPPKASITDSYSQTESQPHTSPINKLVIKVMD